MNTQYKVGDHVLIKGEIVDEYPDWGDYRVKITRADGDYNEIDLTPELFNNSIEASLRERAEKAEARIVELQDALDTSAQVTAKQIAKSAADLQRAEKAEAIINGMLPMWIAAMNYCEHGRAADLDRMRNYYNGRNNPLTHDELTYMLSFIPEREGK